MVQINKKDKKVLEIIHSGKIDAAELALPALADSIILTMKHYGFLKPLNYLQLLSAGDNCACFSTVPPLKYKNYCLTTASLPGTAA